VSIGERVRRDLIEGCTPDGAERFSGRQAQAVDYHPKVPIELRRLTISGCVYKVDISCTRIGTDASKWSATNIYKDN